MKTWHENDNFWESMTTMLFGEQRWTAAPVEAEHVVHLLGLNPGASVLDLCCGPGRHSLELARRGFRVTGVDRTAAYIGKGRKQAQEEGLAIDFIQGDMRHFCRPNAFDGAMSMFTSFGYFEDPAENRQVLANVYHSLKDQGTLIMEMIGKEVLARIFRERDWWERNGAIFLGEHRVDKNWSWMENRWIMLQGRDRHEFKMSHWLYSATELTALLKECGFGSVDIYGDLEGVPYDHKAKRLVAVAHK